MKGVFLYNILMSRLLRLSAFLLLLVLLCFPGSTLAQQAVALNANTSSVLNVVMDVLSIIFEFFQVMAYISLQLLGGLLDPELIFEINKAEHNGTPLLLSIWQFSRDMMNVFFAFMLVFAALYTVVTAKRELVQEHLANFVIAVVLVNFSWFFPRVILDIANVLTATVYQIPASIDVVEDCERIDEQGNEVPCRYVKAVYLFPEESEEAAVRAKCADKANPNIANPTGLICVEFTNNAAELNSAPLGMLNGLFINYIRVPEYSKVVARNFNDRAPILSSLKFAIQLMFVLFFLVAAVLPLIAMLIVFMIRIPILWVTTAFMPFMFIGFVLGDKLNIGDAGGNTMDIFKKFVAAAFLPTVVAIPLAIGFIMLNTGLTCPEALGDMLCGKQIPLIAGIDTFWGLLWQALGIFVLWTGFFAALKIDSYFSGVGESIKSVGESWFGFIPQIPLSVPILPAPGGGGQMQSINEATNLPQLSRTIFRPSNIIDSKGRLGGSDFGGVQAPGIDPTSDAVRKGIGDSNIATVATIRDADLDKLALELAKSMRATPGATDTQKVVDAIKGISDGADPAGLLKGKILTPQQLIDLKTKLDATYAATPPPTP